MLIACCAIAQAPLKFEVASVKPQAPNDNRGSIQPAPGGFQANGIPLKLLIEISWRMKEFQVLGGPDWINTEKYDVLAKAASGMNPTPEQTMAMLQALLAERFQLKTHRETKDLPAFALVATRGAAKLQRSGTAPKDSKSPGNPDEHPFADKGSGPMISLGHGILMAQRITMQGLADSLGRQSDRTVIDKTGIDGEFDLTLKWNPEADQQDASGTSLFTAIQEQLGLKLESTRSPVEVLVIDSVQRPSAN